MKQVYRRSQNHFNPSECRCASARVSWQEIAAGRLVAWTLFSLSPLCVFVNVAFKSLCFRFTERNVNILFIYDVEMS